MSSKMYLAMSLTLGLSVFESDQSSKPRYLWRNCQNHHDSNFYNSELEIKNIFENDTIKMADYADQVMNDLKHMYISLGNLKRSMVEHFNFFRSFWL